MKYTKVLAALAGIAAAATPTEVLQQGKYIRGLAQDFTTNQAKILEALSNKDVVEKLKTLDKDNISQEDIRELQYYFDLENLIAIINFLLENCLSEILTFEIFNLPAVASNLLTCVQESLVEEITGCLGTFTGFVEPLVCIVELGLVTDDLDLFAASENAVDSSGDDRLLVDSRELQSSDLDSTASFEPLFTEVLDILDGLIEVDEETCENLFGTAEDPGFFGCLSLFDAEYFAEVQEFLEDGLPGESCETLASLTGLDNLVAGSELFDAAIFQPFEALIGKPFSEWTSETFDEGLAGIKQVFSECDEIEEGSLEDALSTEV
eukprot:snap_masked-scaffold_2-processed-gene-4.32-mRNA-1 protein AED:1.00 eAED:1.00 QI:0/-1/0/0/-1/1/1/0/321